MLGLNQSVSSVPVSSRTTKLHSAISPSMKDQWSGKTLRICFFIAVARPVRSSAQLAAAPTRFTLGALAALVRFVRPRRLRVLCALIGVTHVPSSWGRPAR